MFLVAMVLLTNCSPLKRVTYSEIKQQSVKGILDLENFMNENEYYLIPLYRTTRGGIILNAYVNGVAGVFLLDTGANRSGILIHGKEKFDLECNLEGEGAVITVDGIFTGQTTSAKANISLSDFVVNDFTFRIDNLDLNHPAAIEQGQVFIDGLLGEDFLLKFKAVIDYSNMNLFLSKPRNDDIILAEVDISSFLIDIGFSAVPLFRSRTTTFLHATVNSKSVVFILDTGTNLILFDENEARNFNFDLIEREIVRFLPDGTTAPGTIFESFIHELAISDFVSYNVHVSLLDLFFINHHFMLEGLDIERFSGIIGSDFLDSSNAIIDYKSFTLFLRNSFNNQSMDL